MHAPTVTVRFSREGPREGVELDPTRVYQVSVDGGPTSEFRSPWSEAELEANIRILRNQGGEEKPDMALLNQVGRELAEAAYQIKGLPAKLSDGPTVYLQLDYPELASIPWELMTQEEPPFHHLLLGGTTFVRKVPAAVEDADATWPTGRNQSLRILFVWGQRAEGEVPRAEHLAALEQSCARFGVDLTSAEIKTIDDLVALCRDSSFHFVHILAHGARTEEGEWGLRLGEEVVRGEQIALGLAAGDSTPALVTVAACDSANDENNTFGSVAYHLHVHGIPLVLASQFRLRKDVSTRSVASVYEELLGGGDLIAVLEEIRRQLAPAANEGWANEVLYSRYRHESLLELSGLAMQQGALRRARVIARRGDGDIDVAVAELRAETDKLRTLADELEEASEPDRAALAETYGLLGSMGRRIAKLRGNNPEDLRAAGDDYRDGFRADRNSHYCGINMIHLYERVGDVEEAERLIPVVRYTVDAEVETDRDFWAFASAGELEVYAGVASDAARRYREFAKAMEKKKLERRKIVENLESSLKQLREIEEDFLGDEFEAVRAAAGAATAVLEQAIVRNT